MYLNPLAFFVPISPFSGIFKFCSLYVCVLNLATTIFLPILNIIYQHINGKGNNIHV